MKRFVFFTLLLTACTTTGNYEQSLQKWIGASQNSLFSSWGMPDGSFNVSQNTQIVSYYRQSNRPIDGNTRPYAGVEVAYQALDDTQYGENLSNYASNSPVYFCKTSFTITNGVVVNYNFNGDDCVSRERIF